MSIPVIYASPPSTTFYVMGAREISAVPTTSEMVTNEVSNTHHNHVADLMVEDDDEEEEEEEEEEEDDEEEKENEERMRKAVKDDVDANSRNNGIQENGNLRSAKVTEKVILSNIIDFTEMATHVWVDGIRDPMTGRYLNGYTPFLYLTKRAINRNTNIIIDEDSVAMGGRPIGILEKLVKDGIVSLQPPIVRVAIDKKSNVDDASKISLDSSTNNDRNSDPGSNSAISNSRDKSDKSPVTLINSSTGKNDDKNQNQNQNQENDDDDDDDFFGTARTIISPRGVRIQKSFIPVVATSLKPSVPKSIDETIQSGEGSSDMSRTPTVGEVEDLRKSKKQRVVSVQARLAERQRYLTEAQQRKQSITNAVIKNKEDQTKEYLAKKSSLLSAIPTSEDVNNLKIPTSSDLYSSRDVVESNVRKSDKSSQEESQLIADRRREDFSLRSVRTSSPSEVVRVVISKEVVESEVNEEDDDDDDDDGLWA